MTERDIQPTAKLTVRSFSYSQVSVFNAAPLSTNEQRVTGVISLSEFELSKLKVYKVERSIYPSIFRIKQRVQPLCLDLFILREIDWKGRVQV